MNGADGDVGIGELIGALWSLLIAGWEAGGLAFLLFIALFFFVTDRFVSGKRYALVDKQWQERWDARLKEHEERVQEMEERLGECNSTWKDRYESERTRAENYLRMLLGQQYAVDRATSLAERSTSLAERAVGAGAPGPPP